MKTEMLKIRVDSLEKKAFEDAAGISGLPLSGWIRERLRRAAVRELEDAVRPIAFLQPEGGN